MSYTIHNRDCIDWMRDQPDNSIDVIITSPPYNLKGLRGGHRLLPELWHRANIDYSVYQDNMSEQDYQSWQITILNEAYRILKEDGSIFYQHKIRNWQRRGYHPMSWIGRSDCQFYQEIIWNRGNTLSIDKRYLFSMTERIYWLCKGKPWVNKSNAIYKNDIWNISPDRNSEHPATFPPELVEGCLSLVYRPDSCVYDPFLGSGTTLLVANKLGLTAIGTDLDNKYCRLSEQRLATC
jgi:site-specific DNA-methyltransferase (adenine-specific)